MNYEDEYEKGKAHAQAAADLQVQSMGCGCLFIIGVILCIAFPPALLVVVPLFLWLAKKAWS